MSKTLSVVVIGRSLNLQERVQLRAATATPLALLAELPNAPEALEELRRLRPQVALLLLNGQAEQSWPLLEGLRHDLPETAVFCACQQPAAELLWQSMPAHAPHGTLDGALEFLQQPLLLEELAAAFAKVEARGAEPALPRLGKVIAVYASKGGCGTTFVAANLAASLARVANARTCLVDLNLQAGDQPLYLGLQPTHSLADVVRNFDGLDEQMLAGYLTPRTERLSLLAAPTEGAGGDEVKVAHVTRVLALLRTQMEYIVLDLPRALDETTVGALDAADERLLLLAFDIPTIRSAKRALEHFKRLGYDRQRVKLVVNRYEQTPGFDLKQVEQVLEHKIYATLVNDPAAVASINVGEPLVLGKTPAPVVRDFQALARRLSGQRMVEDDSLAGGGRGNWFLFGRQRN